MVNAVGLVSKKVRALSTGKPECGSVPTSLNADACGSKWNAGGSVPEMRVNTKFAWTCLLESGSAL